MVSSQFVWHLELFTTSAGFFTKIPGPAQNPTGNQDPRIRHNFLVCSGPPAKSQGQPLESLTSSEIEQDCCEILLGIISQAVTCSEEGTHGPTGALISCDSATCSLGGVDPPQDLALALSNLVSSNSRYVRKTLFNCGGCEAIIRNTSFCPCGTAQDFPALLIKRTWEKILVNT